MHQALSSAAGPVSGNRKPQLQAIEQELGYPLEWEALPARRDCRISAYLNNVDPEDEAKSPRQHAWLASKLNEMYRVFSGRVRVLDADDWRPEREDGATRGPTEDA